jgi:hypothetical protein
MGERAVTPACYLEPFAARGALCPGLLVHPLLRLPTDFLGWCTLVGVGGGVRSWNGEGSCSSGGGSLSSLPTSGRPNALACACGLRGTRSLPLFITGSCSGHAMCERSRAGPTLWAARTCRHGRQVATRVCARVSVHWAVWLRDPAACGRACVRRMCVHVVVLVAVSMWAPWVVQLVLRGKTLIVGK